MAIIRTAILSLSYLVVTILHTIWTVNDVTEKDPLERPRGVLTASEGSFPNDVQIRNLERHPRGISKGLFTATLLKVHSVCSTLVNSMDF